MSENNMPASSPDGFESCIRNQAGNIIFKVFGPQDIRAKPPSKIVQQLALLQDLITEALLAAHKATLAAPDAAQIQDSVLNAVAEFLASYELGSRFAKVLRNAIRQGFRNAKISSSDAVRQARRETCVWSFGQRHGWRPVGNGLWASIPV